MRKLIFLCFLFILIYGLPDGLPAQAAVQGLYQRGLTAMEAEDWYSAVELFLETLRQNPAHAEATAALAECYYELGEFDQALNWVRRARTLARTNMALANLEAFTLIALGQLNEASLIIDIVLQSEPNNREAIFAAAELDIARGRIGDAMLKFRAATNRYPDDRRLLVSFALVLSSMGDMDNARFYIERALLHHPWDYRVHYFAAYLAHKANRISDGIEHAHDALFYRPGFIPARFLLASLYFNDGQYSESERIANELININRDDSRARYLRGVSLVRMGNFSEARDVLSMASSIDPENEFIRAALEELLISHTRLEDPARHRLASMHFNRASDYRGRHLMEQALFEYRRGLRLNPYAPERREYAELLRLQGYPARYLEELRFMQDLGLGDQALTDAIETYNVLLSTALFRRWDVDPVMISKPHWNLAIFSIPSQSSFYHADAGAGASSYIRDILVHERNIFPMNLELRQPSFSAAFRTAREAGADYFLLISVSESERDLSIKAELFVGRTGALAAEFSAFRTGASRLRYASRSIVDQLSSALPFRSELIIRRQDQGLIDKGRADGVSDGDEFEIIRRGSMELRNEGIGLVFFPDDVVGRLVIERADEEVSVGRIIRQGFFDRISQGDEVIFTPERRQTEAVNVIPLPADPELRSLLRMLR
ncbi:MAG: tetratricopeptide repeat protein [Treponema sp.]|nr:tetratricopeptide repeat protein [Treponema sp.]